MGCFVSQILGTLDLNSRWLGLRGSSHGFVAKSCNGHIQKEMNALNSTPDGGHYLQ
ncbi:hypothetical protein F2Q69_00007226 [Brassica cretica]|nr:hypothetical protein F2Q69_00007226 [Brassica cretica]